MTLAAASNASLSAQDIVISLGREAKDAASILVQTPTKTINAVLETLSAALLDNAPAILAANAKDLAHAKEKGLSGAMLDRLMLNDDRIKAMAKGVDVVRALDDPTDKILWQTTRPNGMNINKISVPIGVLGMIYESRPNVTIDASILCLKSHNAVILRGGSESLHSSLALHKIIQDTLVAYNLPKACVSMIPTSDRDAVGAMLRASDFIDVMIPRGGKSLVERVMNEARMPVFAHLEGLCHIYVDASADAQMARDVCVNAKLRRTGICGAMETLLFDNTLSTQIVKDVLTDLLDKGCAIVGDEKTQSFDTRITPASEEDWRTEYLDAKLSCRFVDGVKGAVAHINHYGSHHTDSIIAADQVAADYFLKVVDSGIVMHNASTQFADGGEFGMGAEIGIATGKMHARGPVALEQLCTYKYVIHGSGQTRG